MRTYRYRYTLCIHTRGINIVKVVRCATLTNSSSGWNHTEKNIYGCVEIRKKQVIKYLMCTSLRYSLICYAVAVGLVDVVNDVFCSVCVCVDECVRGHNKWHWFNVTAIVQKCKCPLHCIIQQYIHINQYILFIHLCMHYLYLCPLFFLFFIIQLAHFFDENMFTHYSKRMIFFHFVVQLVLEFVLLTAHTHTHSSRMYIHVHTYLFVGFYHINYFLFRQSIFTFI